jgi:hypothetical protein
MQVSFIQKSIVIAFGAVAMLGATAGAGQAFNFVESGDQSDTALAAPIGTATGIDYFRGTIDSKSDADLYSFYIGAISTFDANVAGRTANPLLDSQLSLFDSAGKAIKANDDRNASNPLSRIDTLTLAVGTYFLGISAYDYDPTNLAGEFLFPNAPLGQRNPRGVLTDKTLAGWAARTGKAGLGGGYTIRINTAVVPVPTPALLPGLVALGFGAIRKRKAKAAVA